MDICTVVSIKQNFPLVIKFLRCVAIHNAGAKAQKLRVIELPAFICEDLNHSNHDLITQ